MAIQHYDEWERSVAEDKLKHALVDAEIDQEIQEQRERRVLYQKLGHAAKVAFIALALGLAVILAVRMAPNWADPVFNAVDSVFVTLSGS